MAVEVIVDGEFGGVHGLGLKGLSRFPEVTKDRRLSGDPNVYDMNIFRPDRSSPGSENTDKEV